MTRNVLLLLVLLFASQIAHASSPAYSEIPKRFFELLKQGQTVEAFAFMNSQSNQTKVVPNSLIQTLVEGNGGYRFHELLKQVDYGSNYISQAYIVGMRSRPSLLILKLYYNGEKWGVKEFNFTSDLDDIQMQKIEARL